MKLKFLFIGLLALSCGEKKDPEKEAANALITSDTIFVTSYHSRLESLHYPIKAIGKVQSKNRSKLIFERSGIVERLLVNNGEKVKKGSLIASLRNKAELLRKEQASVDLQQSLSVYENELLQIADSAFYGDGWDRVKEKVQLKSGVTQARAKLNQASHEYNQTLIKASQAGIIEGIRLREGDFINSGLEIGSIYDSRHFEVECMVLEYDLMKIRKGTEVLVYPLADGKMELKGSISEVNPAVDANGQSLIRIDLSYLNGIVPGLSVRVEINVTDEPSIIIPMHAVVNRSERHVVFNVENGKAKWNYVTLGKNNGEEVQVLEGIIEGMEIITSNNLQLAHDSPVRLE